LPNGLTIVLGCQVAKDIILVYFTIRVRKIKLSKNTIVRFLLDKIGNDYTLISLWVAHWTYAIEVISDAEHKMFNCYFSFAGTEYRFKVQIWKFTAVLGKKTIVGVFSL
jgi:hypothetical protein